MNLSPQRFSIFHWRFWPLQCLGWLVIIFFTFPIKLYFLGTWQMALAGTLAREGFGFFATVGLRLLYRPLYPGRSLAFLAFVAVGASLVVALLETVYVVAINYPLGSPYMERNAFVAGTFCYRACLFGFWSVFYFGIRRLQDAHAHELAWRDAEIRVLRAQINPHFLFNALNTLHAVHHRETLSDLIQNLANYLRYSLRFRSQNMVMLSDEYEAAINYLAVEKARFRDRLDISTHLDEAAACAEVPGIILQPLLENAIKHGRRTSPVPLKVTLSIVMSQQGEVEIEVVNTGCWQPQDENAREPESGVGLENIRQRLALFYSRQIPLEMNERDGAVRMSLRLPSPSNTPTYS